MTPALAIAAAAIGVLVGALVLQARRLDRLGARLDDERWLRWAWEAWAMAETARLEVELAEARKDAATARRITAHAIARAQEVCQWADRLAGVNEEAAE